MNLKNVYNRDSIYENIYITFDSFSGKSRLNGNEQFRLSTNFEFARQSDNMAY